MLCYQARSQGGGGGVGGGGACECPRGGCFPIFRRADDGHAEMSKGGGGAPGVPPIQVQTPPTWLAGYGPGYVMAHTLLIWFDPVKLVEIGILISSKVDWLKSESCF